MSTNNRLTQLQFYEVCKIVEKHKDDISAIRTYKDVLKIVNKYAKFRVTEDNVRACMDATGVSIDINRRPTLKEDVMMLDFLLTNALGQIRDLNTIVVSLCKELGFDKEPDVLKRIYDKINSGIKGLK